MATCHYVNGSQYYGDGPRPYLKVDMEGLRMKLLEFKTLASYNYCGWNEELVKRQNAQQVRREEIKNLESQIAKMEVQWQIKQKLLNGPSGDVWKKGAINEPKESAAFEKAQEALKRILARVLEAKAFIAALNTAIGKCPKLLYAVKMAGKKLLEAQAKYKSDITFQSRISYSYGIEASNQEYKAGEEWKNLENKVLGFVEDDMPVRPISPEQVAMIKSQKNLARLVELRQKARQNLGEARKTLQPMKVELDKLKATSAYTELEEGRKLHRLYKEKYDQSCNYLTLDGIDIEYVWGQLQKLEADVERLNSFINSYENPVKEAESHVARAETILRQLRPKRNERRIQKQKMRPGSQKPVSIEQLPLPPSPRGGTLQAQMKDLSLKGY